MRYGIIAIAGLFLSCSSLNVKSLSEDFETIKGTLVAPPVLEDGDDRLVLYVNSEMKVEDKRKIIVAVCENKEKDRVLASIKDKLLLVPNEVVFLYGKKVKGQWREYISGIDFEVVAIGVYNPASQRYHVLFADYGDRARDAIHSLSWSQFIQTIGKAAIKQVM